MAKRARHYRVVAVFILFCCWSCAPAAPSSVTTEPAQPDQTGELFAALDRAMQAEAQARTDVRMARRTLLEARAEVRAARAALVDSGNAFAQQLQGQLDSARDELEAAREELTGARAQLGAARSQLEAVHRQLARSLARIRVIRSVDPLIVGTSSFESPPIAIEDSRQSAFSAGSTLVLGPDARSAANASPEHNFVDVVALLHNRRFKCSGVMLTANVVATARHCIPVDTVVVGPSVDAVQAIRAVRSTVEHPSTAIDLALLRILPITGVRVHVRRGSSDHELPSGEGLILGFGAADRNGRYGLETLRVASVSIEGWGCSFRQSARSGCVPDYELVVRGDGNDTCRGDSGGGLFERYGAGYRLLGITSRALPGRRACGQGGIYTRMDVVAGWIREQIEKGVRR